MDPGSTHAAAAAELGFDARIAARGFDVSLRVGAGETVAILGPNGAGKSTLLGLIAGLVAPDDGAAVLTGRTLFDTAERVVMPPHARGVSLLAQEPLLFPHLSVLDNVAFGPRSAGASARESRAIARTWLDEVDAADLAARRSASPWPARSPQTRSCCCSTNRSRPSTCRPRPPCGDCCAGCSPTAPSFS
jgi:ABC-type sulfate/molybdate transport systems ATPase subunit